MLRGMAAGALTLVGGGCAFDTDVDHAGPDAPEEQAIGRAARVAWVFGSGGPRGFVHVGVLKALEELRLAPDLMVGASVGSLVAALSGAGLSARQIEDAALDLSPVHLARLAAQGPARYSGAPLAELVRQATGGRRLEQFPVRAACVAIRAADRAVVAFTAGDPGLAVQASSAIEGQFAPVRLRGDRYADPDMVRPLPVREALRLGARRVLAVDVSAHEDRAPKGAEPYREADLRKRALTRPDAALADLVLHPDSGYWAGFSRAYREHCIATGYQSALAKADSLRALHNT